MFFGFSSVSFILLATSIYGERNYLAKTGLIKVDVTLKVYLEILLFLPFFSISFITLLLGSYQKYLKYSVFIRFAVEFVSLLHVLFVIDNSLAKYGEIWSKTGPNELLSEIESNLSCCGYYDVLTSVKPDCSFPSSCEMIISSLVYFRKKKILSLAVISIIIDSASLLILISKEQNETIIFDSN